MLYKINYNSRISAYSLADFWSATKKWIKIFLVLSALSAFQQNAHADPALEAMHIIDWHVHVAGLGFGGSGNFINDTMRNNYRFRFFMKWMGVTEKELEEHGDQILVAKLNTRIENSKYVDQAVILALDGVIDETRQALDLDQTQVYVSNKYVHSQAQKYPNLLFGASINPNRTNSLALLNEAYQQGAVLIKWIPSIMYIDPSAKKFIPFYRRMAELDMPLLTHAGMEQAFPQVENKYADPKLLELPLRYGVTVIAAHIATTGKSKGQDNFERILGMFPEFPNLYADISSLALINKRGYLVKALRRPEVAEKMIYGSDWPLLFFPLVTPWYYVDYIGFRNAWNISRHDNEWDRDVLLKQAFGVSAATFTRKFSRLNALH